MTATDELEETTGVVTELLLPSKVPSKLYPRVLRHNLEEHFEQERLLGFSSARSEDLGVRLHHGALTCLWAPSPQTEW